MSGMDSTEVSGGVFSSEVGQMVRGNLLTFLVSLSAAIFEVVSLMTAAEQLSMHAPLMVVEYLWPQRRCLVELLPFDS